MRQPAFMAVERRARRRRRRRRIRAVILLVILAGLGLGFGYALRPRTSSPTAASRTPKTSPAARHDHSHPTPGSTVNASTGRLNPDWRGDGNPVTLAFAGDVNFPSGTGLADRLADNPDDALGTGVPALLGGANLSMVNLESAVTNGTCPDPQPKSFDFYAPASAYTALRSAGITVATEANNHGEDCGPTGLQMTLAARASAGYPVLGIGQNVTQAFAPYQTVIAGQHIGIIAATEVIDSDLQTAWTATPTQPGLASAYDVNDLISAVEAARRVDDTVVVFLHWGVQLDACPGPLQEPLANALVQAGADIVVGTHAHVPLGGGYLGSAYVDYGLGNFAFYNAPAPTNQSGALVITVTGRHIDGATWRPALIEDELPVPLSGSEADEAQAAWSQARGCTNLASAPGASLASASTETSPATPSVVEQLSRDS